MPVLSSDPRSGGGLVQRGLVAVVRFYRYFLSPWLGSGCRFEPTCSRYAIEALQAHGAAAGSLLTARRLLRCHPGCAGGHDPVPLRPASGPREPSSAVPTSNSP